VLLINSDESPEIWQQRLNIHNTILTLPAETEERAELRFIGAACSAAAARLLGVISRESLTQAIRDEIAPLGGALVEANLNKALTAFDLMESYSGTVKERQDITATDYESPDWIDLPFEDARIAAPAIHAAATSVEVKTGLWRTLRPVIDYSRCNRCWWVCSTFCPDGAIDVDSDGQPRIDYDHCKGCMVCVAQCPPHAIEAVSEQDAQVAEQQGAGA
jgi:pyruvate ferredoxin oxidoreductase gamma subunit